MFKHNKLTLVQYVHYRLGYNFPSFLTNVLLLFKDQIQDTTLYLVLMSPQSSLILFCDSLLFFPCFAYIDTF